MPRKKQVRRNKRAGSSRVPELWLYIAILALCGGIIWLITLPEEKALPEPEVISSQAFDLQQAVAALEKKFSLPGGSLKVKETDKGAKLALPVDRSRMDLTFANMLVKGEFESRGAIQVAGEARRGKQVLTFMNSGKEYLVTLSYESPPAKGKPVSRYIAIVVDDFGSIGGELLQGFLDLPVEVNFAIFSDMEFSGDTMSRAHAQGRETLIHVPMEPLGYPQTDPGKHPILVQMDRSQVEKNLLRHINALPLCAGVNNHMGSLATTDKDVMGWVMEVLRNKKKFYLDSRTSSVSVAYQTAQKAHIPAFRNDLFLDSPDISQSTMEAKLEQIRSLAAYRTGIVAITHCHSEEKLAYLKAFISRIKAEGFTLVPLFRLGKSDVPLIM
jgi:polysaccharide deacetylase 2 family uncharacterized protein YibQ